MEEDIKILEDMRDTIYGTIQFEDDYEVRALEQKQFDALNLAINHLRKTKLVHSQFIPKSLVREKIEELKKFRNKFYELNMLKDVAIKTNEINLFENLLQEGDDKK